MPWLPQFKLGRPGQEYTFDVNPQAMQIDEGGIIVRQRNLAGDMKKAVLKKSAPTIRINSNYLLFPQRNQFASLVGISDTLLSFQTRDDWEVTDELVTIVSTTEVKLANTSATRLSKVLTDLGYASIITIEKPWKTGLIAGSLYGEGGYGDGGYGSSPESFDPGTVVYDDSTRIITFSNPLPDITADILISYLYKGWLVDIDSLGHKAQGGWIDRFQYDFALTGA